MTICEPCFENCLECYNKYENTCIKCIQDFVLINNTCLSKCYYSYQYWNSTLEQCVNNVTIIITTLYNPNLFEIR